MLMTIGTLAPPAMIARRVGCLGSGLSSASLAVMHYCKMGVTEFPEMLGCSAHACSAHLGARLKKSSTFRIGLKTQGDSRFAQDHPFCAKKVASRRAAPDRRNAKTAA